MNASMAGILAIRSWGGKRDTDPHLLTLLGIGISLKAKHILELGVLDGNTTGPLLEAAAMNDGILISVDCVQTSFVPRVEVATHWQFRCEKSLDFLEGLVYRSNKVPHFDLIYIDDCHAYSHVKRELELIDKLADPSTVILMHDLMAPNTEPRYTPPEKWQGEWDQGGPQRAVHELDRNVWEWATIPVSNGLTLLRKKV
jgi:predicted O-methyltransferase YrrM